MGGTSPNSSSVLILRCSLSPATSWRASSTTSFVFTKANLGFCASENSRYSSKKLSIRSMSRRPRWKSLREKSGDCEPASRSSFTAATGFSISWIKLTATRPATASRSDCLVRPWLFSNSRFTSESSVTSESSDSRRPSTGWVS